MTTIPLKKILMDDAVRKPEDLFSSSVSPEQWLQETAEGQLAVDVYQTRDTIVIKAPIAGVRSDDIDISIHNDLLTIRGRRSHDDEVSGDNYFYRECYWGTFSRSIILPTDVKTEQAEATLKNGILTITLPKAQHSRFIKVRGVDE